jgi:hypothetical protein
MRRVLAMIAIVVLGTGPTVGDIGGCGATATEMSEETYAAARRNLDCRRCKECAIATERCRRACEDKTPETDLPATCRPLRRDGDVCVRALRAASCEDYASFMDDVSPTNPTECDFCRFFFDGAVQ